MQRIKLLLPCWRVIPCFREVQVAPSYPVLLTHQADDVTVNAFRAALSATLPAIPRVVRPVYVGISHALAPCTSRWKNWETSCPGCSGSTKNLSAMPGTGVSEIFRVTSFVLGL